jgi:phosphoribosylformylglycinamidine synthase subunit PurQ / glutaminase
MRTPGSIMTDFDPRARDVRVLVITGYGLNCEAEVAAGFSMAGATTHLLHASELFARESPKMALACYHIIGLVGGFSFGDHIQSGRVFANRLRFRLGEDLARFASDGGLILGICNGFQVLAKLGLLPGIGHTERVALTPPTVTHVDNDRHGYFNSWVRLAVDSESPCVFTRGVGPILECPSRHGEGKLVFASEGVREHVEAAHLCPVRYADVNGQWTENWPDNPNGSPRGIAGLCNPTGRVFGLMPHPDAYLYPENHPDWIAQGDRGQLPRHGLGLALFLNAVDAVLGTHA